MTPLYNADGKHWNNGFKMFCHHCKEERHMNDRQRVIMLEYSKADSEWYGEEIWQHNFYEVCNDCIKDYLKKNPAAEVAPKDNYDSWFVAHNPKPVFSKVGIMRKVEKLLRGMSSAGFCGDYANALRYEGRVAALIDLLEESFVSESDRLESDATLKQRFENLEKLLF